MTTPNEQDNSLFPTLSPELTRALDAAIERRAAGRDAASSVSSDSVTASVPRTPGIPGTSADARVNRVFTLLDTLPVEAPSADLVERTLHKIESQRLRSLVEDDAPESNGMRIGFRMSELAVIAAMFIVAVSLVWPMLDYMRADARKVACANNLNVAGAAVSQYASDNQSILPNRGATPGDVWWNVGKSDAIQPASNTLVNPPLESNSSHLYTIVRDKYVNPDNLNCPGNPDTIRSLAPTLNDWPTGRALSYSYQNQYASHPTKLDRYRPIAMIADKNPLFIPRANQSYGLQYSGLPESTNSRFHKSQGQNVLFRDMSVIWSPSPILGNGDNIWTANNVHNGYRGTETPAGDDDAFLVP